jgi:aspartyl-tRNA synthetase
MAISGLMRTHHCGELRAEHIGQTISLCGWVNKSRDLGGLHFKDIRDKYGMTQLNFSNFKGETSVSLESTILVKGRVQARPFEAQNKKMPTGEVELLIESFEVLSMADKDRLPFLPTAKVEATEDLKLKYRYLDLRAPYLQSILALRSKTANTIRTTLLAEEFVEVETPILYKSTPEGARDYIVPSRVWPGKVYALPQSPQTLKQLLMIGGTDKYFQIVKCFRDEDLRADRQPEFTQVDIEVSFASACYIKNLGTKILRELFNLGESFELETMSYQEAMESYGSDKPDFRFGLKHINTTDAFSSSSFKVFSDIASGGGLVKAVFLEASVGALARKDIDGLTEVVKPYGGKGVAWFKVAGDGSLSGGVSKFVTPEILKSLQEKAKEQGYKESEGLWLFCGDLKKSSAHACMDAVRRFLAEKFDLYEKDYAFKLINDFPLLEYDEEEGRFYACHHPFTHPHPEDVDKFLKGDLEGLKTCRADAYDIVCNGYEIAGGSVRIHEQEVQAQMFRVLGMSEEETKRQFGFFLEALSYGVPPHAGVAFGFDRLIMMLAKTDNIRDVIAFPKTATASDLMSDCPSIPSEDQTKELHFSWRKKD